MVLLPPAVEPLDVLEPEELLEPLELPELLEPLELLPEEFRALPEELLLEVLLPEVLPGFDCPTLVDEVSEAGRLLALLTATLPQALRLRQIIAAAATSSGEDRGSRIRPWVSF